MSALSPAHFLRRLLATLFALSLFLLSSPSARAQNVDANQFAGALAGKLGFDADFLSEPERSERLRAFLAGDRDQEISPQSFLSASPGVRLTTDPAKNNPARSAVESPAASAEIEYRFYTIRPGPVNISARSKGGPQLWQVDDAGPVPMTTPLQWSETRLPPVWLEAGEHRLKVIIPPGGAVSSLNIGAPCVPVILPMDLAESGNPLTFQDKTAAMVRALGREDLLPPADEPAIKISAAGQAESNQGDVRAQGGEGGTDAGYMDAARGGGTVNFQVQIKESGVYTLAAEMAGTGGASWEVNGCQVASTGGDGTSSDSFRQERIASLHLEKGTQQISVFLRRGAKLRGLTLQRHKSEPKHYEQAAQELGLSEGPAKAPVTETALRSNLSNPALDQRKRDFDKMKDEKNGLFVPPSSITLAPVPDLPPENLLPSEEIEAPYDTPASPYVPQPALPLP